MKARTIARVIVAALLGVLIGVWLHSYHVSGGQLGRDQFLAKEGARFDKFFAHPSPITGDLLGGLTFAALAFGIYELLAFGLSKVLDRNDDRGTHEN